MGWEYLFELNVSALMERDPFQQLKPYVLLSSSHKEIEWLQKTWNATRPSFLMLLFFLFMVSFCNKYRLTVLLFVCYMFYIQKWEGLGRGGVRCSNECIHYIKLFLYFTNILKPLN